jgi:acetyltransferase-like isoleucine patch superfamily enzyme
MINNPKYKISGDNNRLIFIKDGQEYTDLDINGLSININGNNNEIRIELPANFISTSIVMDGDNNKFILKTTLHRNIRHTTFGLEGGSEIYVGSGMSSYRDINIVAKNGKNIHIGNECMFAREIMVRNNDGHIILDNVTKEIINAPEDIFIGDNVWIGMRSMILKGSHIPNGSIIGAMSLVNKKFEQENILIAGVPARQIRENVEWHREDYAKYMKSQEI